MYKDTTTAARMNGRDSKAFGVRVGVHQGSAFILHTQPDTKCAVVIIT